MIQEERYRRILEQLKQTDIVKVTGLVKLLGVSIDTVRRDLEQMEKRGLLRRVHGGAVLEAETGDKLSFPAREFAFKAEKIELAERACDFVTEGQAVAINAGTTGIEVAARLAERFERLTVLTNGLRVAAMLAAKPGFTVLMPGGVLDFAEHSFYGKGCEEQIRQYNFDVAFLSVNAISREKGITDFRLNEVGVIQAMMGSSKKSIVVADSSKLERVSYMKVCSLAEIDVLVTDSKVDRKLAALYENEVAFVYAESQT